MIAYFLKWRGRPYDPSIWIESAEIGKTIMENTANKNHWIKMKQRSISKACTAFNEIKYHNKIMNIIINRIADHVIRSHYTSACVHACESNIFEINGKEKDLFFYLMLVFPFLSSLYFSLKLKIFNDVFDELFVIDSKTILILLFVFWTILTN